MPVLGSTIRFTCGSVMDQEEAPGSEYLKKQLADACVAAFGSEKVLPRSSKTPPIRD